MSPTNDLLVRRMLDAIDREYADVLTLRTLGARVGRQPAYLGQVFRTALGLTVRQCRTRLRLEHAADMIRAGTKIEAVSLTVGYRSKKNFYRQFKRHYGTTPAGYRRQCDTAATVSQPA
jgi:YesN/AraC family two-component response regulator